MEPRNEGSPRPADSLPPDIEIQSVRVEAVVSGSGYFELVYRPYSPPMAYCPAMPTPNRDVDVAGEAAGSGKFPADPQSPKVSGKLGDGQLADRLGQMLQRPGVQALLRLLLKV